MPLKFVVCDLLITKENAVYITELCPALSCLRFQNIELFYATILRRLAPQGFRMLQAPQEPMPEAIDPEKFLSHYERDSARLPFSTHNSGRIPKAELRHYLSKVFLQHADAKAALWVMYFRDG